MAVNTKKTTVQFFGGDSKKPSRAGNGIELHMPFPLNLYPGQPVNINLSTTCNTNLVIGSTKIRLNKNVFLAGENITLEGIATVQNQTLVEIDERIAVAIPQLPDFEII